MPCESRDAAWDAIIASKCTNAHKEREIPDRANDANRNALETRMERRRILRSGSTFSFRSDGLTSEDELRGCLEGRNLIRGGSFGKLVVLFSFHSRWRPSQKCTTRTLRRSFCASPRSDRYPLRTSMRKCSRSTATPLAKPAFSERGPKKISAFQPIKKGSSKRQCLTAKNH